MTLPTPCSRPKVSSRIPHSLFTCLSGTNNHRNNADSYLLVQLLVHIPLRETKIRFRTTLRTSPMLLDNISSMCRCEMCSMSPAMEFNVLDTRLNMFFIDVVVTAFILYTNKSQLKRTRETFNPFNFSEIIIDSLDDVNAELHPCIRWK